MSIKSDAGRWGIGRNFSQKIPTSVPAALAICTKIWYTAEKM
jgi:hypothetical protein